MKSSAPASTSPAASVASHQPLSPNPAPFAPTVTATKVDSLITDVDVDGKADPGDTLRYTVTIGASGMDATGVNFTDTVDPQTAFVGGSLSASPVAVNDTFPVTVTGNVKINSANLAAPFSVVSNDFLGINPSATISAFDATTANGGQIVMTTSGADIGKFTYNPPPGFEGTDTFTYVLSDNANVTSAALNRTATVSITVSGMIWFINNNTGIVCPCDGRLTNPFNTLAAFAAINDGVDAGMSHHPAANDNIFLYESGNDYNGPVTLLGGQKFIGQDATQNLATISGITPVTGSDPSFPTTPNPTGAIVNIATNGITVGSGNTLRGFTGGNSTSDITGTSFGTLNVSEVTLNGTGNALNLTTGTLNGSFASISANGGATGISLSGVGGSLTTGSTTISNSTGIGISVGSSGANLSFANTSVSGTGGTGVSLTSNTGTITFGALSISPNAGQRALLATENTNTITATSGTISTTTGVAVEITKGSGATPLNMSLTSVSANGATSGIVLTRTNGSFTVAGGGNTTQGGDFSGGTIQNTTAAGIALTSTVNVSLNNMRIQNTANAPGIDGTGVTNFSFTNGTISGSGTTSHGAFDSNIAFNDNGATINNVDGTVTITNNILSTPFQHGVDVLNNSGTLADLNISNNAITSATAAASSAGSGIRVQALGSASGAATITKGELNGNNIQNFPNGAGIVVQGGNVTSLAAPSGNFGTNMTTGVFQINNNLIRGQSLANPLGTNCILVTMPGRGTGFIEINGNGTVANPLQFNKGNCLSINSTGAYNLTATANNNVVKPQSQLSGSFGMSGGADKQVLADLSTADSAILNLIATGNNVSSTTGVGIYYLANSQATLNAKIQNNTVAAPTDAGVSRPAIRVDSGTSAGTAVDTTVCVNVSGNTATGSNNGGGFQFDGIAFRKEGTSTTTNSFGIVGLSPNPATDAQMQTYVRSQNPAEVLGVGGGGAQINTHGANAVWTSCSLPASIAQATVERDTIIMAKANPPHTGSKDSTPVFVSKISPHVDFMDPIKQGVSVEGRRERKQQNASPTQQLASSQGSQLRSVAHHARMRTSGLGLSRDLALNSSKSAMYGDPTFSEPRVPTTSEPAAVQPGSVVRTLMLRQTTPVVNKIATQPQIAQQDKNRRGVIVKPGIRASSGGGETVTHSVGTLLAGKTVRIQFQVTVNNPYAGGAFVTNQGTVSGSNFANVLTDDPAVGGANDPTQTPVLQIPNVSASNAEANEPATGTASMLFTISLSAPAPAAGASVHYATADQPAGPGHAVAGVDYVAIPETPLNFAGGEQVKVVTVTILSDADSPEPDETFLLNLTNAANATIVGAQATGTIKQGNAAGTFLISEFRTSGPGGEGDDFIELYNNSDSPLTVAASDASGGYGLFKKGVNCSANPILIGVIPNGTVIPARGHYLFVGSAYSLANYGGSGAAAGDQTLTEDIEWDTNIAIFNTTSVANLSSVTRLDAVGFSGNLGANCLLLSEGATVTPPAASVLEFSFQRDQCGKKGNPAIFGLCPSGGLPVDTNDNANDFVYSDTTGGPTPQGQRLGAPGPENLTSPLNRNSTILTLLLDSNFGGPTAPNRVRNLTPVTNGANGTISVRRRFVNNTGAPVTRLRFRIVDISTTSVPGGIADLRALTSADVLGVVVTDNATCSAAGQSTPCTLTVQGTTLETPPAQPNGGANNSTFTVNLGTPLAAGASLNLQFLLGVQQTGSFKFFFNIEALP